MNYFLEKTGIKHTEMTPAELMVYMTSDDVVGELQPKEPAKFMQLFEECINHPNILFKSADTLLKLLEKYPAKMFVKTNILKNISISQSADLSAKQGITFLVLMLRNEPTNETGVSFTIRTINSLHVDSLLRKVNINTILESL